MAFDSAIVGSVQVALEHLSCERKQLTTDEKNVGFLIDRFWTEKCRPFDKENRIPVLLSNQQWQGILQFNNIGMTDLTSDALRKMKSEPVTFFIYLSGHGTHRIKAAQLFLPPNRYCWGGDLINVDKIATDVFELKREARDGARPVADGIVFGKISDYHGAGDTETVRKWMACLSPFKKRDLKQLDRNHLCRKLNMILEELTILPALFVSFQPGTLHRWLPMRCPEELVFYFKDSKFLVRSSSTASVRVPRQSKRGSTRRTLSIVFGGRPLLHICTVRKTWTVPCRR